MLDLFAPPPAVDNRDLLNSLLRETFADARLQIDAELAAPDAVSPEIDPARFTGLYDQADLVAGENVTDSSGWLVDVGEFERNQPAPVLPDASEFTREKLASRPGMEWLGCVETVLVPPHSRDPAEQRVQLAGLIDIIESEAFVVPDRYFPRKHIIPYQPRRAIGLDTETTGLDTRVRYGQDGRIVTATKLVGLCLAPHSRKGYYLPVRHTGEDGVPNWDPQVIAEGATAVMDRFLCVLSNAGYDLEVLALNGATIPSAFPYIIDTQVCSYIRDINNPVHGLKSVSLRLLNRRMVEIAELFVGMGGIKKNAYIAFDTLQASQAFVYGSSDPMNSIGIFEFMLAEPDPINIFLTQSLQISLDHQLIDVVRSMVRTGLPINYKYFFYACKDAIFRQILLQREIDRVAGRPVNVGSGPQLRALLFDQFKLEPLAGMKRGASGSLSLDEKALANLHAAYPELEILELIVRFRKISTNIVKIYTKLITNSWVDAFQPWTRVKLSFSATSTSTGRFASSGNSGRRRVSVKVGSGKVRKLNYTLVRGAWEGGVNAQGLPAKIPFRTAQARRIRALPPGAGIDLSHPYPPDVEDAFLAHCAKL